MTAEDCFGLQPEVTLRIAVIDVGDETLLVWVRDIRGAPAEYATFDAMLASIRFDDERAPSTTTTTVAVAQPARRNLDDELQRSRVDIFAAPHGCR